MMIEEWSMLRSALRKAETALEFDALPTIHSALNQTLSLVEEKDLARKIGRVSGALTAVKDALRKSDPLQEVRDGRTD